MASISITCTVLALSAIGFCRQKEIHREAGYASLRYGSITYRSDVWFGSPNRWPDVTFPDICTYLLFSPSPCTKDDVKAYKSTEAWKCVTSGYACKRDQIAENKGRFNYVWLQPRYMYLISHLLHHPCRSSIARK